MPLYDEYAEQLRSEIADMLNTGGRPAGACTAAMFLKEFAGGLPWAHLDVAGTAWADEAKPWMPKGPSGVAVRALAELAFTSDDVEMMCSPAADADHRPGRPAAGRVDVSSPTCCSGRSDLTGV